MNAILKLEVIGDDCHAYMRALDRGKIKYPQIREMCRAMKYGQPRFYPTVARIMDAGKQFVKPMMKDYSHARKLGNRGVFDWYALKPGQYEVRECIELGVMQTKQIVVNQDGSIEGNDA